MLNADKPPFRTNLTILTEIKDFKFKDNPMDNGYILIAEDLRQ